MAAYNNLVLSGTLFTAERWSTHCSYKGYNTAAPDRVVEDYGDLLTWAEHVRDHLSQAGGPFEDLGILMSSSVTVDTVRVEYRDEGGLIQAAEVSVTDDVTDGTASVPAQVAVVTSLRTGRPGRSYRGRMYWPFMQLPISSSTGLIPAANQQSIAEDVAACLTEWGQFDSGADMDPAVYSPTLDEVTEVTSVQVGQVPDTQRRRRDDFQEQYVVVDL